jgi:uncharacterized protein
MNKIVIILTENCNANCEYCYVNKRKRTTTKENIAKCLLFLKKVSNPEMNVQIILSGGEPFLEYGLIKYAVSKSRNFFGDDLSIDIPTNGILLDTAKLEFLKKNKVNLSISIDGLKQQNTNRALNSGGDTFHVLEKKIPLLLKYRDNIRLRITITPKFSASMYKCFVGLYKKGFIKFDVKPAMGRYWSDRHIKNYLINLRKIIYFSHKNNINLKVLSEENATPKKAYRCGSIENEMMVDSDGDIYPCLFFLTFNKKARKKYKLGNVNNKHFHIGNPTVKKLLNFKICHSFKNFCQNCVKSKACSMFCLSVNIKTKKKDKRVAISSFKLERGREFLIKKASFNNKNLFP